MAKRYDPVLGKWIHGLSDDAPEFGPVSEEPITIAFDGSRQNVGYIAFDGSWQNVGYTVFDESHVFSSESPFRSGEGGSEPIACRLCMAPDGGCRHTGWIPDEAWAKATVDEETIRIPPAERAGPAMIGDGVLRATVSGLSWMAVKKKLAAVDDVLLQLAKVHAPCLEERDGKLVRPECQGCFDTNGFREDWPCESATILLRRVGLTERDLDYQLGDELDGGEGGVQGA